MKGAIFVKKLVLDDIEDMKKRPNLEDFFVSKENVEVWRVNGEESATTEKSAKAGRKTLMLAVATSTTKYMVIDTIGAKDKPDKLLAYLVDDAGLSAFAGCAVPPSSGERFVVIPREKLGRPKSVLSDEQKQQIAAWRQGERGERLSINAIAERLHVGNRLVMEYCKTLP